MSLISLVFRDVSDNQLTSLSNTTFTELTKLETLLVSSLLQAFYHRILTRFSEQGICLASADVTTHWLVH
eukprot:m.568408 g.568408  ORF g.568408 m.568408 type:complete len:70 (+) comp57838_c0_seq129:1965-2174(+)